MDEHADNKTTSTLQYGVRSRCGWPRRVRWLVAVGVLLALALLLAWWRGSAVYRHVAYMRLQSRCMGYEEPVGTVVYEEDPQQAARYLASPPYVPIPPGTVPQPELFPPPLIAVRESRLFLDAYPMLRDDGEAVAFMHRRRSPGGHERLVVVPVGVGGSYMTGFRLVITMPIVVVPASWRSLAPPRVITRTSTWSSDPLQMHTLWGVYLDGRMGRRFLPNFRLYAGQPDPADASHFTIDYDLRFPYDLMEQDESAPWQRGRFHGWLMDDDTVDFRVEGPLEQMLPGMPRASARQ